MGKNFFPLDLAGPNVEIGYLENGKVKPIKGVSITAGQVDASDEKASFAVTVTAEQDVPASYDMAVSVHGIASNGIPLIISPPSAVHTVTVDPAAEHGEAFAGTSGELKYTITVTGETTAFPISLMDNDKVIFVLNDDDNSDLPEGISVLSGGMLTASGVSADIIFRVNAPAGESYIHSVIARILQRESNPFTLEVKPVDLTGLPIIQGTAEDGETLTVDISDLPGTRPVTYYWQIGSDDSYTDVEEGDTYVIGQEAWEKRVRVVVEREGFTGVVTSQLTATILNPTGESLPDSVTLSIGGTAKITHTLTANLGGFPEGKTPIFQWQHGTGGNFIDINGAEGSTYLIQPSDADLTIRVGVTAAGYRNHVHSDATATVTYPTVTEQFEDLFAMTTKPDAYNIIVYADETIGVHELDFGNHEIEITLKGAASTNNTLTLDLAKSKDPYWNTNGLGFMFDVRASVTLKLENVTLVGIPNNMHAVIINRGTLIMNEGTTIRGNTNNNADYDWAGGGVHNKFGATFTMTNGTITGNNAVAGGGVTNRGDFIMKNGAITENTATVGGGGVTTLSDSSLFRAKFTMEDGRISNNTATPGNDARGGGVYVNEHDQFTMYGGEISGNEAATGGGISLRHGTISIINGTISANKSIGGGSGIEIYGGNVQIANGIIYGKNAGSNSNIASAEDVYSTIAHSNSGRTNYGLFDNDEWADISWNFSNKGVVPSTDLTVHVFNGALQIPLSPIGLKIDGIDNEYVGMKGRLFLWDETFQHWYDVETMTPNHDRKEITTDTEFRWPFWIIREGAEWDFRLEFFDEDDKFVDRYSIDKVTLDMGFLGITTVNFSDFVRYIPSGPVTKITIVNMSPWEPMIRGVMASSFNNSPLKVAMFADDENGGSEYASLTEWNYSDTLELTINKLLESGPRKIEFGYYATVMWFGTFCFEARMIDYTLTPGENVIDFAEISFFKCTWCEEFFKEPFICECGNGTERCPECDALLQQKDYCDSCGWYIP